MPPLAERAGVEVEAPEEEEEEVEVEEEEVEVVEEEVEGVATITGSPRRVQVLEAGTVTATAQGLDGASSPGPTTTGEAAEGPTTLTRATLPTLGLAGGNPQNPSLRITRGGGSPQ